MLWQRVLTAAVGIPVVLLLIYAGGWYLAGAVALLTILGLREFYALCALPPQRDAADHTADAQTAASASKLVRWAFASAQVFGYLFAVLFPAAYSVTAKATVAHVHLAIAVLATAILGIAVRAGKVRPPESNVSIALLGSLCLPLLFGYLVLLRQLGGQPLALARLHAPVPAGACWLFLVFAASWAADTAAYSVGRVWGRRKLCPAVSPGKTVEGAIGGLAASIVVTGMLGAWFGLPLWSGLLLGATLGVTGQLGDLAESRLKRWAGVIVSGALLPGHGGVLDRFDSLLFSAPVAFYYLRTAVAG
jgi:phosphatidate cytidylyltransferase